MKLTELPKWLCSKIDFNEARKLINNIRADTNKVKSSSGDEKVFNDLNGLINDIQNKKTTRKSTIKKIRDIISDLDQQRQKKITVLQSKMIDVACYLFNVFGLSTQPGRLILPKGIKISKKRFNEILSTVTEAKNNGLETNVDGREVTLDNAESLLKGVGSGKIDQREFKKKYNNIVDDVEKILNGSMLTRNQNKVVEILSLLKELFKEPLYEQPDTTDMLELESEESAEQRGQELKI